MKQRLISLLTALALCLSLLPVGALATEKEPVIMGETTEELCELPVLETAAPLISFFSGSGISLKDGHHEKWIDRLADLPDYATDFYAWLEENSDADGTADALIDVTMASIYSSNSGTYYVYEVVSFEGTAEITYPSIPDKATLEELASAAVSAAVAGKSDEVQPYVTAMFSAFDRDHPEVFWLDGQSKILPATIYSYTRGETSASILYQHTVYFVLEGPTFDIRAESYQDPAALRSAISTLSSNVNAAVTATGTGDRKAKLTALNKYLTEINAYNSSDNLSAIGHDCREVTGAISGKTGTEGPVCEAYARAFKVVCDKLGIPCVLISGDGDGEPHMWNAVQMENGKWYAVDVTWNDPFTGNETIDTKATSGYETEKFLLVGTDTKIDGTSFATSHIETNTVTVGGTAFTNGPVLESSAFTYDLADANVWLSGSFQYTGAAVEPTVEVFMCGRYLNKGTEFTVAFKNNTAVGVNTATATVTAVDGSKYTGTKTRTFTIAPKQVTPVLDYYSDAGTTKVYDGTTVVTDTSKLGFLKTNSGILSSEADDVEFTANYAFTDPNAGSAKEIIATDITLTGAKAGNYKLTTDNVTDNLWATITKAPALDLIYVPVYYLFGTAGQFEIDLAALLKEHLPFGETGDLSYELFSIVEGNSDIGTATSISGNTLTHVYGSTHSASRSPIGVKVTMGNFEDSQIHFEFIATAKYPMTITGVTAQDAVFDGNPHAGNTGKASAYLDGMPQLTYNGVFTGTFAGRNDTVHTTPNEPPKAIGDYTVTLSIPSGHETMTGSISLDYSITAPATGITKAPEAITGLTYTGDPLPLVTAGEAYGGFLKYSMTENGTYSTEIPVGENAGEYTVWYYFDSEDDSKDTTPKSLTVTIAKMSNKLTTEPVAAVGLTYDGSAHALLSTGAFAQFGNVEYSLDQQNWIFNTPTGTDAGSYTVYYKVAGGTNYDGIPEESITVTIAKAIPTYTAPTAKTDLVYDSSEQPLVTAGSADGGTVLYSLTGEENSYAETVPSAINAGTYTVWYKVVGDSNHNDIAPQCITVTMEPATLTPVISGNTTKVYDGTTAITGLSIALTGIKGSDDVTAKAIGYSFNSTNVAEANTVTATDITLSGNDAGNYVLTSTTATAAGSITKADAEVSAPPTAITGLSYTGSELDLIHPGTAEGGAMQYRLGENGSWSAAIPTAANTGTHQVWYKVVGDSNHNDTEAAGPISVTVSAAANTLTTEPVAAAGLIYDGSEKPLLTTAAQAKHGTVEYSLDNTVWSSAVPSAINAGTYTVYYKVTATDEYAGISGSIDVTVAKADPEVASPSGLTATYGDTLADIALPDAANGSWTWVDSTRSVGAVGSRTFSALFTPADTVNYNAVTRDLTVAVGKADSTVTAPTVINGLIYSGEAQALITAGSAEGGIMQYRLGENGSWSAAIPTGTDVGSYVIYYKVAGDANHNDTEPKSVGSVISPKSLSAAVIVLGPGLTYTGSEQTQAIVSVTVDGKTLVEGTNYTVSGNTGTEAVSYGLTVIGMGNYIGAAHEIWQIDRAAPVVTAPTAKTDLVYDGSEKTLVTAGSADGGTVLYSLTGEENSYAETVPSAINAGTYTVWYKVKGDEHYSDIAPQSITVTVAKADPVVTAPTAIPGLIYNGDDLKLISAGSAEGGTIMYTLTQDGPYTADAQSVTAITPTTHTVWYRVVGDSNHNDTAPQSIEVPIAKATLTPVISGNTTKVYDGTTAVPGASVTLTGVVQGDTVSAAVESITYSDPNAGDNKTVTAAGITLSGAYADYYVLASATATATGTITKADARVLTAPSGMSGPYTGQPQPLVTAGTAEGGAMMYASSANGPFSAAVPTQTHAGLYTVYYKVAGDANHNDSAVSYPIAVTITKAPITVKADNKSVYVGGTLPTLTYTVTGLKGSDTLTVEPTLSYESEPDLTKTGTVAILISGAEAGSNYILTHENGTLTISNRPAPTPSGPSAPPPADEEEEPEVIAPTKEFEDVHGKDHWAKDAVDFVVSKGLFTGKSDTIFDPDGEATRAQIVTVLWRLAGSPVVNYLMPFEDVAQEAYYGEAIRWAASTGIVTGYDARTFGPNDSITREQLAAILWRYAKHNGEDVSVGENTNILSYTDAFSISEYAYAPMQWACGAGVMGGYPDGSLQPRGTASRAHVAQMLKNYLDK